MINWYKIASKGIRITQDLEKSVDVILDQVYDTCLKVKNQYKLGQGRYTPFPLSFTNPITNIEKTVGIYIKKGKTLKIYYMPSSNVIGIEISNKTGYILDKEDLKGSLLHEIIHSVDPALKSRYKSVYDNRGRIRDNKYYNNNLEINSIQSTILNSIRNALESKKISPADVEQWLKANRQTVPSAPALDVSLDVSLSEADEKAWMYWRKNNPQAVRIMKERVFRLLADFKNNSINSKPKTNKSLSYDFQTVGEAHSLSWYKIAQMQEESNQQTFDFYKDVPQTPVDPRKEYQDWIDQVNPQDPNSIKDILEELKGFDNIIKFLTAFKIPWNKVDFLNGPVLTVSFPPQKKYYRQSNIHVIDDFDYPDLKDSNSWINDIQDHSLYDYVKPEEQSFWDDIGDDYKLYHATDSVNKANILKKGLTPMNKTRGISNSGTPSAVFTTDDPDILSTYGDLIFEINAGQMKKDGYMPLAELEEPVQESNLRKTIAYMLGDQDYEVSNELHSDGIWENTVIIYGVIPPKYLTVFRE